MRSSGFLTMLRHPAEVLGSRQTYYATNRPWMADWEFAVWNLCGWINGTLVLERQTRGSRRTFVRYDDLLDDWRSEMRRVAAELGVSFDTALDSDARHAVDDFIDPGLRRHGVDWKGWDLPQELTDIAQATWDALSKLSERGGHDAAVEAEIDLVAERYATLYRVSRAIAQDVATAKAKEARSAGEKEGAARARKAARKAAPAPAASVADPSGVVGPPAAESRLRGGYRRVGRRVLARVPALRAVWQRLRRR